jgi:CheY-like chemotaxis protein
MVSRTTHRRQNLVLVVDDDPAVLDSMATLLSSFDFLVSRASSADQAIQELGAQRPDVIMTDIFMPAGDGYELLEALRRFRDPVPVVAMTGTLRGGDADFLGMAKRLGAVAVLEKPLLGDRVIEVITALIAGTPVPSQSDRSAQ